MSGQPITCVLCDRAVGPDQMAESHRLPFFDNVVICPDCLRGERDGYGDNAAAVRRSLAARRPRRP